MSTFFKSSCENKAPGRILVSGKELHHSVPVIQSVNEHHTAMRCTWPGSAHTGGLDSSFIPSVQKQRALTFTTAAPPPPPHHVQRCQVLSEQLPILTLPGILPIIFPLINSDWKQII